MASVPEAVPQHPIRRYSNPAVTFHWVVVALVLTQVVIGFTFYRTKNLIPGIIAHGIFDAVQIFVLIPIVFKMTGMGP